MRAGTLLRLGNFTHITTDKTQLGYNAGKKSVFIALLLGIETRFPNKEGVIPDELDLKATLAKFGFYEGSVDWVECAQFLLMYKDWPGDERDLCRVLLNLKQHGMSDEQVKILVAKIEWCVDNKEKAWEKVYITFKQMYRAACHIDQSKEALPKPPPTLKKKKKK